jgi:hypothetical protein
MASKTGIKDKRGPEPERVKIAGTDWKAAVKKALKKPMPAGGWPKRPSRYKKREK